MNKSSLPEFNHPSLLKEQKDKIHHYILLGSEWVKRDALRAFRVSFGDYFKEDEMKDDIYNAFCRAMFSTTTPCNPELVIMDNKYRKIILDNAKNREQK